MRNAIVDQNNYEVNAFTSFSALSQLDMRSPFLTVEEINHWALEKVFYEFQARIA